MTQNYGKTPRLRSSKKHKCSAAYCALLLTTLVFVSSRPASAEDILIPDDPFLNDVRCLALSPYYVTRNVVWGWWMCQKENASFFHPSARFPSGRKPNLLEKAGFAVVAMPLSAVVTGPVILVTGGVLPVAGHLADLVAAPLGHPLRFHRLDGSSFPDAAR